jgi:hypothetical protein
LLADRAEALAWLTTEQANLLAVLRTATSWKLGGAKPEPCARVIHLRTTREPTVYPNGSRDRIASVPDLVDVVPVVRAWAERKPLPEAAGASYSGGERA